VAKMWHKCGKKWFALTQRLSSLTDKVTRYNQDNNNSNNNNRRLAELARQRCLHDERARAEQHERAIVDNANVPTAQMVNAIIGSIRDPLQREQALAVIQSAALERQEQEDRDKALFVSGLTGDPCDGLKYGKYPCINHRDPNVGDGTKCRSCYRNLMRNARAGMTAEERYAEKLERKRERDEERAVRAREKRVLRQRLRNAAAHKRRVRLGLVNNTANQHATSTTEASVHVSPCLACSADTVSRNCICPLCQEVVCPDCQRDHVAGHQRGQHLPPACVECGAPVQYERCNSCSACGVFACQDHQQQHWHIAHGDNDDDDRDGCERDLSKLSLADREEERLQQLEDQWCDAQDSDYDDDDDDNMEESSSSGGDSRQQ
jgi:hypothetical protein